MVFVIILLCGLFPAILGRSIADEKLTGRSPLGSPAAVTAETALQFLLRNDQDMCLLKLVCGAGANVSRYGVYADSIANSLGYTYHPFDFSVVRSPNLAEKLKLVGRDASSDLEDDPSGRQSNGSIFIRAPKFDFKRDFTWMVKITPTNATVQNISFLSLANNESLAIDDSRSENESLSLSGHATEFSNQFANKTLDDDDVRADEDFDLLNEESTEGAPSEEDISVGKDFSKEEGGSQENEANEDMEKTNSGSVTEASGIPVSSTIALEDFTPDPILESNVETEDTFELQERSGFPATYVFNRAFALGLRSGSDACTETFGECPMNVDRIVRFGSNLFMSPASTSDKN